MSMLKIPTQYETTITAQNKWLRILQMAQHTVEEDDAQQQATSRGMRLRGRHLPPEVLGRNYARYCDLVNKMYDAYLNNVQLQRAPYILEIITVIIKRLYELRNELVHIIVNDYIYVDSALKQLHMTPADIEIVVPYHLPLESRSDNVEKILQQMWVDALKRKRKTANVGDETSEEESEAPPAIVQILIPKEYTHTLNIQRHERYRQSNMKVTQAKALARKLYFLQSNEPAPIEMRTKAALWIQKIYRNFMKIKRKKVRDNEENILLGIAPDPFRRGLNFVEENNKLYERRKNTRLKIKETYLKELEKGKTRLLMLKKDNIIEDITDEIREWFREWYYGYNFFPQFPYELEGGTLIVLKGNYPTIAEQLEEDERLLKEKKGKTKDQLKEDRKRAKAEEAVKAKMKKHQEKIEAEALVKARCDPFGDPGYTIKISGVMENLIEVIRNYRLTWSIYDQYPPEKFGEVIYGYMKPLLVEDVMKEIHSECRKFVDELMRIDLKMLIKKHRFEYKQLGLTYPKLKPRAKPKVPRPPKKITTISNRFLKGSQVVFDLGIVTKPTTKFSDIFGDSSYVAYDYNIRDPDASFPPPGYGDIKRRLMLSCVLGCGIQPGAPKRKGVMLLGPDRNGKSFLADAVAGELNAVKIDISPEVFTAVINRPKKILSRVFVTARAFQPAVVFMKNVERVYTKRLEFAGYPSGSSLGTLKMSYFSVKVPAEQKYLKATSLDRVLQKLVKSISHEDKVIFIATCSNPWVAKTKPLLSMFDEVLLVPRTDYATLQQFFYKKFQSIRSIPRDYPIQPLAQLTQGIGFGDIIEVYNDVMTPERIVRLNVQELSPAEFLQLFVERNLEPLSIADYQKYVDFFIANSGLQKDRKDYALINLVRENMYEQSSKKNKVPKDDLK